MLTFEGKENKGERKGEERIKGQLGEPFKSRFDTRIELERIDAYTHS